jgi:hypothetical protein
VIEINEEPANDLITVTIENNCKCMLAARDAPGRPAKKPAVDIPYLEQVCNRGGGHLSIQRIADSAMPFERLSATMQYTHPDRPPLGDILSAIQTLIVSNPNVSIKYIHRVNGKQYRVSTEDLRAVLDEVPFETPSVLAWIKENMGAGLASIMPTEVLL